MNGNTTEGGEGGGRDMRNKWGRGGAMRERKEEMNANNKQSIWVRNLQKGNMGRERKKGEDMRDK